MSQLRYRAGCVTPTFVGVIFRYQFRASGLKYSFQHMKKSLLLSFLLPFTVARAQNFTLKSRDLGGQATNQQFFNGMGCTGSNLSPQLTWENPPQNTQAFAVTMYDKDAPTGSGWWHWVIFNIPGTTTELKTGAGDPGKPLAPAGSVQSLTDFGKPGYGGPCPPPGGAHQYLITVYALKSKLELDQKASPALVGYYLTQAALAKASLVIYGSK